MGDRSMLTALPLRGKGTGQVQSLSSYVEHLGVEHNLRPPILLDEIVRRHPLIGFPHASSSQRLRSINTGTALSNQLLERIQGATGASLQGATLQPLTRAMSTRCTLDLRSVYCPVCVQQDEPLPYSRLLWEISFVTACPIHGVHLRSAGDCGASISARLPLWDRPALKGVCSQCGTLGFRCIATPPRPADVNAVFVAKQVERVIALYQAWKAPLDPATLVLGIRKVVDAVYGGKPARASVRCGFDKKTVSTWLRETRPSFASVLQLCFHAAADPVRLLQGHHERCDDAPINRGGATPVLHERAHGSISIETLRERLLAAARSELPPSMRAFARANGVSEVYPPRRLPLEASLLSHARKDYLARQNQQRIDAAVAAYTAAAHSLLATGRSVNRGTLTDACGGYAFAGHKLKALTLVLTQFDPESNPPRAAALAPREPQPLPAVQRLMVELNDLRTRARL